MGRTGRAGVKGFAMSFVDKGNWKEMESAVKFLKHVLKATDQKIEADLEEPRALKKTPAGCRKPWRATRRNRHRELFC